MQEVSGAHLRVDPKAAKKDDKKVAKMVERTEEVAKMDARAGKKRSQAV